MREIKFRSWNKTTGKMIDLKKITPLALDSKMTGNGLYLPFSDEWPLMQYAGRKDRNDKEIYEADIVGFHNDFGEYHIGEIVFHDCMFGIFWEDNFQTIAYIDEPEVIGNVYENPEILIK